MAAFTTIAAVVGAAAAVGQYSTAKKAAGNAEQAAERQRISDAAAAQATQLAAGQAVARDKLAREVEANQALAAAQLGESAEVTIADPEAGAAKRRRVQATFDVGSGGAGTAAGSIRV